MQERSEVVQHLWDRHKKVFNNDVYKVKLDDIRADKLLSNGKKKLATEPISKVDGILADPTRGIYPFPQPPSQLRHPSEIRPPLGGLLFGVQVTMCWPRTLRRTFWSRPTTTA